MFPDESEAIGDLPGHSATLQRLLNLETLCKDDYKRQLHNTERKVKRSTSREVTMKLKVSKAERSLGEVQESVARAEEFDIIAYCYTNTCIINY